MALAKKLAVRAKPGENQFVFASFPIDQQQIRFYMTFAAPGPIATQTVVAVASFEQLVGCQGEKDRLEHVIEVSSVLTFGLAFVVALEGGRPVNRPHEGQPSGHQQSRNS